MFLRMQTWSRMGMGRQAIERGAKAVHPSLLQRKKPENGHILDTEIDELISMRRAILKNEKQKMQKQRKEEFLKTLLDFKTATNRAELMLNRPLPHKPLSNAATKLVRISTIHELASLNAAVAAIVMALYDFPEVRNYENVMFSFSVIKRVVPDLVQDFKNLVNGHNREETQDILSTLAAICTAVKELSNGAAEENIQALNDSVSYYLCPAVKLFVSVLSIDEGTRALTKAHKIKEMAQDIRDKSSTFAQHKLKHSGSSTRDISEELRCVELAAQAMIVAVQLTAPTILAPSCQSAIVHAVITLVVAVEKLDEGQWTTLGQRKRKDDFDEAVNMLLMMVQSEMEMQKAGV